MRTLLLCIALLIGAHVTAQKPMISSESAKSDIQYLIKSFEEIHYNPYFIHSKEDIQLQVKNLTQDWTTDSIGLKEFATVGMKLTALMSGGHSYMEWRIQKLMPEVKAHLYLPVSGKLNEDGTMEVTKSAVSEIPIQSTIVAINNIPVQELYEECLSYIGGIPAYKKAYCEVIFPLYLFFNEKLKPPYAVQLKPSNSPIQLEGMDINSFVSFINQNQKTANYTFKVLPQNIGLLSYNSCNGYKAFKRFLKSTFKQIEQENIQHLIIDIRDNGGGDSGLNDLLLSYLTTKSYQQSSGRYWKVSEQSKKAYNSNKVYARMFGKEFMEQYNNTSNGEVIESFEEGVTTPKKPNNYFDGKSCFLIGPNTFSSANFLADAVSTYKLSTLIGQPTGEYTNDFGEQLKFMLPTSKCLVAVSSTYDIGANGNHEVLEPVHPNISVSDDALEYAIEWIKK